MKKNKYVTLLLALSVFAFTSCNKDDDDTEDSKFEYHAHIHSPNTDDKHVGDTIHINVELESHSGEPVHHANIRIFNKADNTEVYNKPDEAHVHETDGKFEYEDDFILSNDNGVLEHTDWYLVAKVWGDSPGLEEVVDTIAFHVHP